MVLRMYCCDASRKGWKSQERCLALVERGVDKPAAALALRAPAASNAARSQRLRDLGAEVGDCAALLGLAARLSRSPGSRLRS